MHYKIFINKPKLTRYKLVKFTILNILQKLSLPHEQD